MQGEENEICLFVILTFLLSKIQKLMSQNRELLYSMEQLRSDTERQLDQVNDKNRMMESQLEFTKTTLGATRIEADSLRVCECPVYLSLIRIC